MTNNVRLENNDLILVGTYNELSICKPLVFKIKTKVLIGKVFFQIFYFH